MSDLRFWPADLYKDLPNSPIATLQSAAAELSAATDGALEARVISDERARAGGIATYEFIVFAHALNFRYVLFEVSHDGITLYPVTLTVSNQQYQVQNGDQFEHTLKEVLSSRRTNAVIKSLLAQSLSISPDSVEIDPFSE